MSGAERNRAEADAGKSQVLKAARKLLDDACAWPNFHGDGTIKFRVRRNRVVSFRTEFGEDTQLEVA